MRVLSLRLYYLVSNTQHPCWNTSFLRSGWSVSECFITLRLRSTSDCTAVPRSGAVSKQQALSPKISFWICIETSVDVVSFPQVQKTMLSGIINISEEKEVKMLLLQHTSEKLVCHQNLWQSSKLLLLATTRQHWWCASTCATSWCSESVTNMGYQALR